MSEKTLEINEKPNSCKISINAKGNYSAEVKVYSDTIEGAVRLALEKASEMEAIVREKNGLN